MPDRSLRRRDLLLGGALLAAGCSRTSSTTSASAPTPAASGTRSATASAAAPSPGNVAAGPPRRRLNSSGDVVGADTTAPVLALTFHGAGAASVTHQVLDVLARAQVHVTVFAVGSWLDAQPDLGHAVLAAGHELGNHTYRHLPMRRLTADQARAEIARGAAALTRLAGTPGHWFRPSGTPSSTPVIRAAAARVGYPVCVSYDVDSLDWTDPGPRAITANVLAHARRGSIVSMHLGHPGTAAALPTLLDALSARSMRVCTVSELLS